MQKIAFQRFGDWYARGWNDFTQSISVLLPFGGLYFGCWVAMIFVLCIFGCLTAAVPGAQGLQIVLQFAMQFAVTGITMAGMAGVSLAVLNGRDPSFIDFQQDLGTHVQAMLAATLQQGAMLIGAILAAIPGFAVLIPGVIYDRPELIVIGVILLFGLMLPVVVVLNALFFFMVPLIVDKKLDFWSAMLQSVDCARRDLAGLTIFSLTWYLIFAVTMGCTLYIGSIFFAPFLFLVQMYAYRDYFGLSPDRFDLAPAPTGTDPYRSYEYDAHAGYGGARGYGTANQEREYQQTGIAPEAPPAPAPMAPLPIPPRKDLPGDETVAFSQQLNESPFAPRPEAASEKRSDEPPTPPEEPETAGSESTSESPDVPEEEEREPLAPPLPPPPPPDAPPPPPPPPPMPSGDEDGEDRRKD